MRVTDTFQWFSRRGALQHLGNLNSALTGTSVRERRSEPLSFRNASSISRMLMPLTRSSCANCSNRSVFPFISQRFQKWNDSHPPANCGTVQTIVPGLQVQLPLPRSRTSG